jgi:hypothetical protein
VADPSETTQVSLEPNEPEAAELLGAVRALSAQVGGLQAELQALRAQSRALPPAPDAPSWDQTSQPRREKSAWMRSLDRPGSRPHAVPRLLLEIVFLAGVAGAAAIAELETAVIVLLMLAAWTIVAAVEWFAARAAQQQAAVSAMPLAGAGAIYPDDPSWFAPPLERPLVESGAQAAVGEDTEDGHGSAPRLPPRSGD